MVAIAFLGFLAGLTFAMVMQRPSDDEPRVLQPAGRADDDEWRSARGCELARWNGGSRVDKRRVATRTGMPLPAPNPTRPRSRPG